MSDQPNNSTDMILMAGVALANKDQERLQELHRINAEWMQTVEERHAMTTMLESMIDAIDEMEGYGYPEDDFTRDEPHYM